LSCQPRDLFTDRQLILINPDVATRSPADRPDSRLDRTSMDGPIHFYTAPFAPFPFPTFGTTYFLTHHPRRMSSDREEIGATKSYTEHSNAVQEDSSVGAKAGQGVSYVVLSACTRGPYMLTSVRQWSDEGPSWYESSAICVLHLLFLLKLIHARLF